MCGIFGYVGEKNGVELAIGGLKKMEYRGYDSAGVAGVFDGELIHCKEVGKVAVLEGAAKEQKLQLDVAIAHTRWATHGIPTQVNAHPHFDVEQSVALVHNGIIENYQALKAHLREKGVAFVSETDTEVIAQLIGVHYSGDLLEAVQKTLPLLEGAFAIATVHKDHPDQIVVAAKESPLIIGMGEGEKFVASDVNAFLSHARDVVYLGNGELGRIMADRIEIFSIDGTVLQSTVEHLEGLPEEISKQGFEHFTLKEICEQPQTVHHAMLGRMDMENGSAIFEEVPFTEEELRSIDRILILACGTSYHAGLVAQYLIEEIARVPCEVEISSEFRYKNPIVRENTLVIAISQSGETADTLSAVRELKAKGAKLLALCNVRGSTLPREADGCILLRAGPEIGVASTKAYVNQLVCLTLFTLLLSRQRDLSLGEGKQMLEELSQLPGRIQAILDQKEQIQEVCKRYAKYENMFFLGRHYMYPTALEGALKLKELSYINANAYPSGELKHGPIALIDESCPSVAFCSNELTFDKLVSNLMEVKARRGKVLAVVSEGAEGLEDVADDVIFIPKVSDPMSPILSAVVGQLIAYYISYERGTEIDQPKNLAKSVTVE